MDIGTDYTKINQAGCCYRLVLLLHVENSGWYVACGLLILFIVSLNGCSKMPTPVVVPTVPLYYIQSETWESIDKQIYNASRSARKKSEAYSRVAMDNWLWRVRRRTEDVFIPWYSSYWTQQWMASRVAWYKMQYSEGEITPEERLTSYLQRQFYDQVLDPVSDFVNPRTILEETTAIYLWEVKNQVEQFPDKYRIPVAELNQHLKFIPAIVVQTSQLQDASLYDVLQITDLSELTAYKTLLAQIDAINGGTTLSTSKVSLNRIAEKAVIKLVDQMELRGGASIASLIVGGNLGLFISAGAATWSATDHEQNKSDMEAQLRDNLDIMLNELRQDLLKDTRGGVTAVVHHMSKQIEYSVFSLDSSGSGLF